MLAVALCAGAIGTGCGSSDSATGSPSSEAKSDSSSTEAKEVLGPKPKIPTGPHSDSLQVKDLKVGAGDTVEKGDIAVVHYVAGIYETGEEIESAWVPNKPLGLSITPTGVLLGWYEGLPGMRVGGRRELVFPTTKADMPPGSGPNDTLVYVVDLVGIE
jgi:peptidylprolyl isomerase